MKNLLAIFVIILMPFFVFAYSVTPITQQQLLALQSSESQSDFLILDVRTQEEFEKSHLLQAINISHTDIKSNLPMLMKYQNKKVVVYCRSGRRAKIAENFLVAQGFTQIHHLTGDHNAWVAAELPLINK